MNAVTDTNQYSLTPLKMDEALPADKHSIRVLDKLLNVTIAEAVIGGHDCSLVDVSTHAYDPGRDGNRPPLLCDVNWTMTYRDNGESPILNNGSTYRFRSLSNVPIMTVWRNRHRWDASETIVATREDLVKFLAKEGFDQPWLIFKQVSIFPSVIRIPKQAICRDSRLTGAISSLLNKTYTKSGVSDRDLQEGLDAAKEVARYYRYADVNIQRGAFHRDNIAEIAPVINKIFFDYGLVLMRASDREPRTNEQTYNGLHGEPYHDLKLAVDRLAIYSGGAFSSGWLNWLHSGAGEEHTRWGRVACQ